MNATLLECKIISNIEVSPNIFLMRTALPASAALPCVGQFYMLRTWSTADAPLLSRPISVHDIDANKREVHFLYEIRGEGTDKLSKATAGSTISLTGPLGNGFDTDSLHGRVALVSGGIGIAPMQYLARALAQKGCTVTLLAGFRDVPYALDGFDRLAAKVSVATETGRYGAKGYVTELLKPQDYDYVCTCGPDIMMKRTALMCEEQATPCLVSLEAKMACGVGACLGCTCKKADGDKAHVCKDGPVFDGRHIYARD